MKTTEILGTVSQYIVRCIALWMHAIPIQHSICVEYSAISILLAVTAAIFFRNSPSDEEQPRCNGHGPCSLLRSLVPAYQHQIHVLVTECRTIRVEYLLLASYLNSHDLIGLPRDDKRLLDLFEDELSDLRCYHCLIAGFQRLPRTTTCDSVTTIRNILRETFESKLLTVINAVADYHGSDARTVADVVYEVSEVHIQSPDIRKKCMEILYKICSRNNLVPGLEQIELTDNPTGTAHNLDRFKETFRRGYLGRALLDMVSEGGSTSDPLDLVDPVQRFAAWERFNHPNVAPLGMMLQVRSKFKIERVTNGNIG